MGETCLDEWDERPHCQEDAFCALSEAAVMIGRDVCGVCEARRALGEDCEGGWPCVTGLWCIAGQCQPRREVGQSCQLDDECPGVPCTDGVCTPECSLDAGEPCESTQLCKDGLCNSNTERCESFPRVGEACLFEPGPPADCDGYRPCRSGRCTDPFPNGAGCREPTDCESGFCLRDYSAFCSVTPPSSIGCSVPYCDEDCGVCASPPTVESCP